MFRKLIPKAGFEPFEKVAVSAEVRVFRLDFIPRDLEVQELK